ncbi:MAG: hypothetical protein PHO02_03065 [Candidatus Nanoarchaeia archaeon]|nr:hypothetical protein [Candidatus Nanoarchaeia archaeon]
MDIKTASVQELYEDMSEKWEILSELFSRQDIRGKPALAVFNINYDGKKGIFSSILRKAKFFAGFKSMPSGISPECKNDLFVEFMKIETMGAYSRYYNLVALNRQALSNWWYPFAMPEEVTHSIVQVADDEILVEKESVASFNGYSSYFGHKIHSALKCLEIENFTVEMDEFFPPFGQSHFLGKELNKFMPCLEETINAKAYFQPGKSKEERQKDVKETLYRLPSLAGFMLAKQYKHDMGALMKEHPLLPYLGGKQIWKSYCLPILINGKLTA